MNIKMKMYCTVLHVHAASYICMFKCMSMSILHVPAASCCFSMLHVCATCTCCMHMLYFHAACPCCLSLLYACAVCRSQCCMSELDVLAECPCRMTVLHVHATCSVADPDLEFLVLDLVTHNYLNMKKMSP